MSSTRFYPVSQPSITQKEIAYVSDAVTSGWVSSLGRYIEAFEDKFAAFCGTEHALAVSNGTTGLHLALVCLGIGPEDEVIVPDLTFVATANAVAYTGAKVVPVDIEASSLCIDPAAIRNAVTAHTRAIIPVHLYGQPARMPEIVDLAREYNLFVIEDAAEAHGARCDGRRVGGFGDCGVFSFYGNKIITSGEGGMITTNNQAFYARGKTLRDHAMSSQKRYWHNELGFNYRMTNLQAALGVAQLERIDDFLEHRHRLAGWYRAELGSLPGIRLNRNEPDTENVYWMMCVELPSLDEPTRDELMRRLKAQGVDSRPYFYPISDLPMYDAVATPVTHDIYVRGLNLPSYFDLTREDVADICGKFRAVLRDLALIPNRA